MKWSVSSELWARCKREYFDSKACALSSIHWLKDRWSFVVLLFCPFKCLFVVSVRTHTFHHSVSLLERGLLNRRIQTWPGACRW
jgi:hypothetical protein